MPELSHRNCIFYVSLVAKAPKVSEQLTKLNVGISILSIMNILHLAFSATAVSIDLSCIFYLHVRIDRYFHRWQQMAVTVVSV